MNLELAAKQLGLLHELLPGAARFAVLVNPDNPTIAEATITDLRAAAMSIGRQIEVLSASTNHEIDTAFASLGHKRADALLVSNDPLFYSRRVHLATLATYHRVPTIYAWRECVTDRTLRTSFAKSASIAGAFLRARGRPICRSCGRPSLCFSSTCKRPRYSVSKCRRCCSRALTR